MNNNDTETIKNIIINTCKRCNGTVFYHVIINGYDTCVYMDGDRCMVEAKVGKFYVDEITSATIECNDFGFAYLNVPGLGNLDLDITKDMTPQQIFDELA